METPKEQRPAGSSLTTCSRLRCEECNVELPATREETPVLTAVKAKKAGVWVKNFIIYGDESGYHYFCCPDHGKAWREKNIPSANAPAQATAALDSENQAGPDGGLPAAPCCASSIPFGTDLTNVAEENSRAADELLATSQFLVDVGQNVVPLEGLEEGVPVRRANPIPTAPSEPHGDNCSSESRVVGATLQCADESVLVGSGLVSKRRIKGDDNQVDPLFSNVGDFVSGHNGVGDSSIILHN